MFDIEGFVNRQFDDVDTYGNPISDLRVNCPFCESNYGTLDTKKKLHISLGRQVVHCFRCNYKRNWIGFVIDVTGQSYFHALGELYRTPNPKDITNVFSDRVVKPAPVVYDIKMIGLWENKTSKYMSACRKYALKRGISSDKWRLYNLSTSDELEYRLIIPIENGYYQARSVHPWIEPKYLNPNIDKDSVIFNAGALYSYDEVVICEGAFSSIHVGANSIAMLGKDITHQQMTRLLESPVRHFILASEPNAEKSTIATADRLSNAGKTITIWKYTDGDPAETVGGYKEFKYSLKTKLEMLFS